MSWLSSFFRKNSVKAILNFGKSILKIFLGEVAKDLQEIAWSEVKRAEESGKSGIEKYEAAFKAIKTRFPEIRESLVNHAIETAVLALNSAKV